MSINITRTQNAVNKFRENLKHKQTETKTQTQTDVRDVSEHRLKTGSVFNGSTTKIKTDIFNNSHREEAQTETNRDGRIS